VTRLARPPERWSVEKNAIWSCSLPAGNVSSVALGPGRACLLAGGNLVGVDTQTGKIAWQKEIGKPGARTPPTPVARGQLVYAALHSGELVCFDRDGYQRWAASVEPAASGLLGSPLLCDDLLIVQGKEMTGLATTNGEKLWSVAMPGELACGSPVKLRVNQWGGQNIVVTSFGMLIQAADGRALTRYNPKDRLLIPTNAGISAVTAGSRVYFCANRPDGSGAQTCWYDLDLLDKDRQTQLGRSMKTHKGIIVASSPLVYGGLVHVLTGKHELAAFDEAGTLLYCEALVDDKERGTPPEAAELLAAGGAIYAAGLGKGVQLTVVNPGRKFEKLWEAQMPAAPVRLAFEGDRVYVSAGGKLYCIARKTE
jgi:hypothetical protein